MPLGATMFENAIKDVEPLLDTLLFSHSTICIYRRCAAVHQDCPGGSFAILSKRMSRSKARLCIQSVQLVAFALFQQRTEILAFFKQPTLYAKFEIPSEKLFLALDMTSQSADLFAATLQGSRLTARLIRNLGSDATKMISWGVTCTRQM